MLIATQTAFDRERKNCCKYVDSVFLSLDDRKAELYWTTTVALTRPFERLVVQWTTRLTTNQEIAGSNPAKLRDRLFTPMFLVFGGTEQDYPVDRHQKNFPATRRKKCPISEDIHCTSEINHECSSQKVGAGEKTAGTNARFPEHRLAKTPLNDKETVHRSVDSVGNQHGR